MKNAIAILVVASICLVGCSSEKPLTGTELIGVKVALKPLKNSKTPDLHAHKALAVLREGGATLTSPADADMVIEQDYDVLNHSVVRITAGTAILFQEDYALHASSYQVVDDIRKFAREIKPRFSKAPHPNR